MGTTIPSAIGPAVRSAMETSTSPYTRALSDSPSSPGNRRSLPDDTVAVLEDWYSQNLDHPYPCKVAVKQLAVAGKVSRMQVRKWMANKRLRTNNTLKFNGSVHPKRLQRIQRELVLGKHHFP